MKCIENMALQVYELGGDTESCSSDKATLNCSIDGVNVLMRRGFVDLSVFGVKIMSPLKGFLICGSGSKSSMHEGI
jgi:hypothetical protein